MSDAGKIMTALDAADVAQLAMVEALRSIAEGQRQMAESMRGVQAEAKEQGKLLMDVRERVIRIESRRVEEDVKDLRADISKLWGKVDALEAAKDRQDGALNLTQWAFRNWPAVIGYLGLVCSLLYATGKIG